MKNLQELTENSEGTKILERIIKDAGKTAESVMKIMTDNGYIIDKLIRYVLKPSGVESDYVKLPLFVINVKVADEVDAKGIFEIPELIMYGFTETNKGEKNIADFIGIDPLTGKLVGIKYEIESDNQ